MYQGTLNVRTAESLGSGSAAVTISCDASVNRLSTLEFEGPDFTVSGKPLNTTGAGIGSVGALRNVSGNHTWIGNVTLTGGGGGSTYQSDAGTLTIVGDITTNMTGRSLTLQGSGNGEINGCIQDGLTVNLPLTKKGGGVWTLSGSNLYSGSTTVSAGTLRVNGALAAGAVSVSANATLEGVGSIGGLVTLNSNAHLAPGTASTAGTLTVAGLTLKSGSLLDMDLGSPGGSDQVLVGGTLTISGGKLNLTNRGGIETAPYTLIDYATQAGSFSSLTLAAQPTGYTCQLVDNAANTSVDLDVTGWPRIVSWESVRTHGTVGDAALAIPDDDKFSEPRSGGVRRLLVTFDRPIAPESFLASSVQIAGNDLTGAAINLSLVSIATSFRNGNTIGVVDFAASLPDRSRYLVRLQGVTDPAGNALFGDVDRVLTNLKGDASGDLRTNVTDLSYIQSATANPISLAVVKQVRSDVNLDGRVNATDLSASWAVRNVDARYIPTPTLAAQGFPAAAATPSAAQTTATSSATTPAATTSATTVQGGTDASRSQPISADPLAARKNLRVLAVDAALVSLV